MEPLIARQILPWFGGAAAVWSVCLVFYQAALLLGYAYARWTTRVLPARRQMLLHCVLLATSLALLPVGPGARWSMRDSQHPSWRILELLTVTVGLPFVVLAATSPLLQDWLARSGNKFPYRFFGLSNFASLAALLCYPLLIEPSFDIHAQRIWWSVIFGAFAVACAWTAWRSRTLASTTPPAAHADNTPIPQKAFWFALSACGSMLLLSVTNHIDANVAAVPLLWILPLAVYLLSFVITFGAGRIYMRPLWLRLLAFSLGVLGYAVYNIDTVEAIQITVPVFVAGLFVCCVFCHGELNRLRPPTANLTSFYLVIAAGGATGAVFVGLLAPSVFGGIYELPLALVSTAALALLLTWGERAWAVRLLWIGVTAVMGIVVAANVSAYRQDSLSLRRSFYGSLRVVQSPHAGPDQTRTLYHGTIEHGAQFLWPPRRFRPTAYYGPDSGIGIVLRECFSGPKRVGVVGLGVGTMAAYGQTGDTFRFYEINRQIIEIAQSLFYYLRESKARIEIVEGDARLSLEHDPSPPFDVLALDAFSGDAIPVHLLTEQAMALYLNHLKPGGVLAFHVSNDYLDLAPVVRQLANNAGYRAVLVRSHREESDLILTADWVLVTKNTTVLENPAVAIHSKPIAAPPGLHPWTDQYNNLLQILKTPEIRKGG
ncbi:MAG TPA: fused MFS/spermidine synthase [Bryobacteraceae bacterium]